MLFVPGETHGRPEGGLTQPGKEGEKEIKGWPQRARTVMLITTGTESILQKKKRGVSKKFYREAQLGEKGL